MGLISGSRKNTQNDRSQWFGQLLRVCGLTGLAFKIYRILSNNALF
ncbi:protein of unknown function [Xenorhabdus nematophila AN6/1]|nr:protein of unknown function [Xenorhabdus nematophila AN6/1]